MKYPSSKIRYFELRRVFVVGALLCLCVSDSAGPRLLPLPAPSVTLTMFSLDAGARALRTSSSNIEPSAYLQMVAGSQYRARDYHYHGQTATHAAQLFCKLQSINVATTPQTYAPLNFKTPHLSIPTGRAPPRFA